MGLLKELSSKALLGSERHPVQPIISEDELGSLLNEIFTQNASNETQVLRSAGVIQLYSMTAYEASKSKFKLSAPCPAEKLNEVTAPELITCLQQILNDTTLGLLKEAIQLLIVGKYFLPAKLLSIYFDFGKVNPNFRLAITEIAGQRGAWLAAFNENWSYVNSHAQQLDSNMWENGNQEQRLLYISKFRQSNPSEARELISKVLVELDARDRARLLEFFYIGLSDADEEFLSGLLNDRSKEVRVTIANLLSHLPKSAFVVRQQNRILGFLKQSKNIIRKKWVLEPPEEFLSEWTSDTIEEKRHQSEVLGSRAWWLYQIARLVPLSWWQEQTRLSPEELITWGLSSDWGLALLRAWHQSLAREKNIDWAEAFLKKMPFKEYPVDEVELIFLLPIKKRENFLISYLNENEKNLRLGEILEYLAHHAIKHNETFSSAFTNNILKITKNYLTNQKALYDYTLRRSLADFVCFIPHDCFNAATQGWPEGNSQTEFFTETIAKVLSIIEHRKTIHQFLGGI